MGLQPARSTFDNADMRKAMLQLVPMKLKDNGIDVTPENVEKVEIRKAISVAYEHPRFSIWFGGTCLMTADEVDSMVAHLEREHAFTTQGIKTPYEEKPVKKAVKIPLINNLLYGDPDPLKEDEPAPPDSGDGKAPPPLDTPPPAVDPAKVHVKLIKPKRRLA